MTHHKTVTTRSGTIAYTDTGSGPVALFVHGVGTSSHLWRKAVTELADLRRCVAIDLPLHGHTPARPGQDFSLGALAAVVADFCAALDLDAVDLVANDTGGAIAQLFAARNPGLIRTFTLTNCDVHDNVPPEAFKPTVELAASGALAASASALLADLNLARAPGAAFGLGYEHPEKVSDDDLRAYLEPVIGTPENAREFERLLLALVPDDLLAAEPALRTLQAPTLIVWGTGDPFFDVSWAYWLRDAIPGAAEVVEIPDARLFFPDERPEDLVPHLRNHWTTHAA